VTECAVNEAALVLGSTQPWSDARAGSGLAVVRRHSGGGAVLVEPDGVAWVDVFVPAGDPLWSNDVGQAFWWLGDVWAAALGSLGVDGLSVHRGGLITTQWSRQVCFAGLGAGEVVDGAGAKVVGMAQRRTRAGALFQCAVPLRWDVERLVAALEIPEAAGRDLLHVARPLPPGVTAGDVTMALLAHFPDTS
jgi:lipoate-protein ligase A